MEKFEPERNSSALSALSEVTFLFFFHIAIKEIQ